MADQVINLLENEAGRYAMRKRAYMFGRKMIWSKVAQRYMESFERARIERRHYIHPGIITRARDKYQGELPSLKLDHLELMTDSTGIFQHSLFTVPNYSHGYTTDDNARALLVTALLKGSDESHGRALCALGTVLNRSNKPAQNGMAAWLFEQTLPAILLTSSPRAWAFALIGINEYSQKFAGDSRSDQVRNELSARLMGLYKSNSSEDWRWFEKELSYCNAVLPHALLLCGSSIPNGEMIKVGLESLNWSANLQKSGKGHFVPIGSNGFYYMGGERARFDQLPVEAQTMVSRTE